MAHRAAEIVKELQSHYTAAVQKYRLMNLLANAYIRMHRQAGQALSTFTDAALG